MAYNPKLSYGNDPEKLEKWVTDELSEIQKSFSMQDFIILKATTVAPNKVKEGLVVFASSPTGGWNPGSGAGFYGYYGGSWKKLG
jgi:hypothetical protein